MNRESRQLALAGIAAYAVAILGAFLIVAGLVWVMYHYTRPAPLGQGRAEERRKILADLQAENAKILNNYESLDPGKGIVRLPIARGMELTLQEYQNPAAARSNLVARAEIANAAPPKAPEKPNPFE